LIDIQKFFFLHFPDGADVNIMYTFLNNKLFHIFQMNVIRAACMMWTKLCCCGFSSVLFFIQSVMMITRLCQLKW